MRNRTRHERTATRPAHVDTVDAWQGNHRALAALALGLAYSHLEEDAAVQQLERSGDPAELQRARRAVLEAHGTTDASVRARAQHLIDRALTRMASRAQAG